MFEPDELIARIDVHILHIEPAIHRTLELPLDHTLAQLHTVLQAAFGWDDAHLHRFLVGGLDFGPPDSEADDWSRRTYDSADVRLFDFALSAGIPTEILYEYDFGDRWVHSLSIVTAYREPDLAYPRCTRGSRSAPPEDCGGYEGYRQFLEEWLDPGHPGHAEARQWAPSRFDPERFELDAVNKRIAMAMIGLVI